MVLAAGRGPPSRQGPRLFGLHRPCVVLDSKPTSVQVSLFLCPAMLEFSGILLEIMSLQPASTLSHAPKRRKKEFNKGLTRSTMKMRLRGWCL